MPKTNIVKWQIAAGFEHAYPSPVRGLFEMLAIDYQKAAEAYQTHRSDSGLHQYGGWFHFVGATAVHIPWVISDAEPS